MSVLYWRRVRTAGSLVVPASVGNRVATLTEYDFLGQWGASTGVCSGANDSVKSGEHSVKSLWVWVWVCSRLFPGRALSAPLRLEI